MKVLIFWLNFGPYHIARLQHLSGCCDLTALELLRGGIEHPWQFDISTTAAFKWITLYNDTAYVDITKKEYKKKIDDLLREINPDVLLIPGYSPIWPLYLMKWAKKNHKKSILMIDSNYYDKKRNFFMELYKGYLVRQFDAAIVAGSTAKEYMVKLGMSAVKIFLGYDVVDNNYFYQHSRIDAEQSIGLREKYSLPQHYFLNVARYVEKKNLIRLIKAYKLYRNNQVSPWGLVLCGDGDMKQDIINAITEEHVDGIIVSGYKQLDEIVHYYGLASALILPSTEEQWGLVVNEAMACGLPIICSRNAGSSYDLVIESRNGYILNPYNVADIVETMTKMANLSVHDRLSMGQASLDIITDWNLDRFSQSVVEVVDRIKKGTL